MPDPTWRPSTKQVARYIRTRTKIAGGGIVGDFTTETKPTAVEVEGMIDEACEEVATGLGEKGPCNVGLEGKAGSCAALYAAMLAEQSLQPETTSNGQSSFASLERLYNGRLKRLEAAVAEQCGEGEGGEGGAGGLHPGAKGNFPSGRLPGIGYPVW